MPRSCRTLVSLFALVVTLGGGATMTSLGGCATAEPREPALARTHLGALLEPGGTVEPALDPHAAGRSDEDRARALALVAEGVRLRDAGDVAGARRALEEALQLDASLPAGHVEWALAAEQLGIEPQLIAAHYQLGARLAPEDVRTQLLAAAWAARQGDSARALEGYDRVLALDSRSLEAWTRRGELLLARGNAAAAVASYERARVVDDTYVPALTGLADAAERAERHDVAESAHRALVELYPDVLLYRTRLVAFYRRTGQVQKAKAEQRQLEKLQPKDTRRLRKLRGR